MPQRSQAPLHQGKEITFIVSEGRRSISIPRQDGRKISFGLRRVTQRSPNAKTRHDRCRAGALPHAPFTTLFYSLLTEISMAKWPPSRVPGGQDSSRKPVREAKLGAWERMLGRCPVRIP